MAGSIKALVLLANNHAERALARHSRRWCPVAGTEPSGVDHCSTTVLGEGLGEGDGNGGRSVGGSHRMVRDAAGPVPPTVVIV
jgi:hypothetical protein